MAELEVNPKRSLTEQELIKELINLNERYEKFSDEYTKIGATLNALDGARGEVRKLLTMLQSEQKTAPESEKKEGEKEHARHPD